MAAAQHSAGAGGREWRLLSRPQGSPSAENFELVTAPLSAPARGEVLVRNTWMSIDPSVRLRMQEGAYDYLPAFELNSPLEGWAVGVIVDSEAEGWRVGDHVLHRLGWREYSLLACGGSLAGDPELIPVDGSTPAQAYLGALSWVGLTAYAGLVVVGELRPGDVVFVSAAAGAVGGLVVQIAKLLGHTVIASAGSAEKVTHVREVLGADAAFSYRDGPVAEQLRACAPEGIDLYFDNVGGEQLEAALDALRPEGRVALCGAIASYNGEQPEPGPSNLFNAVAKGLTLRGFMARFQAERMPEFRARMREWLAAGQIVYPEYRYDGIEQAPRALIELLEGRNIGKVLVRLGGEDEAE